MSSFPVELDNFTEIETEDIAYAAIANSYQTAIVACQTQLESMIAKNGVATQKILGLTYRVNAIAMPKWYGSEPFRSRLSNQLAENSNSPFTPYGPYSPEESFVTLNIPNAPAKIPNGHAFDAKNTHFVTVEAQGCLNTNDIRNYVFENHDVNKRKSGGPYIREGLLYHNGVDDLAPKYVTVDWTPLVIDDRNKQQFYTVYTFLIHLVIIG